MKEMRATYQVTINNTEIWPKRLGHFHHAIVLNLQRNELVHDLAELDDESPIYKVCQYW